MQWTITIPENLLRKMKALSALDDTPFDVDDLVLSTLDQVLSRKILDQLGMTPDWEGEESVNRPVHRSSLTVEPASRAMAVADGLSSEDFEDEGDEEDNLQSGLSLEQIARDNAVSDPKKEAVSEDNEEATFDELFPAAPPPIAEDVKPVRNYAKKMPKIRGKVTAFTGGEDA